MCCSAFDTYNYICNKAFSMKDLTPDEFIRLLDETIKFCIEFVDKDFAHFTECTYRVLGCVQKETTILMLSKEWAYCQDWIAF